MREGKKKTVIVRVEVELLEELRALLPWAGGLSFSGLVGVALRRLVALERPFQKRRKRVRAEV